jgi:ferredoxin
MRLTIDLEECQGYACCIAAAPEVFELDEDADKARILVTTPSESQRAEVEEAVESCPVRAISIVD